MQSIRPYKQVLNFLMEIIEQASFEPDYKLPSERMLAVKFNASRRSVRLAYEHLIDQGFVCKVHGKGHFTTGNKEQQQAVHTPAKKIYFIVSALKTVFARSILYGITDFCDEHTLDVSIKISKGDPQKEARFIRSAFTSDAKGIILFPLDNESINNELLKLSANRYPLVIIDRYLQNINSSFVATDNHNAMVEAVKFLRAKKHEHILYLTSPSTLATSVGERLNGFYTGIKKYYPSQDNAHVATIKHFSFDDIYQYVTAFLKSNPKTEVIVTPGFQTATDAIVAAVNDLGLSIPNDVKLMIFDNDFSSTELNLIRPYAIEQDAYQIGYRSAATLYNQLYGDLRTEIIRLPVDIVDYTETTPLQRERG